MSHLRWYAFIARTVTGMNASAQPPAPDSSSWRARYDELWREAQGIYDEDGPTHGEVIDKARALRQAQRQYYFECMLASQSARSFVALNEASTSKNTEEHDREAERIVSELEAKEHSAQAKLTNAMCAIGWGRREQRAYAGLVDELTWKFFEEEQ